MLYFLGGHFILGGHFEAWGHFNGRGVFGGSQSNEHMGSLYSRGSLYLVDLNVKVTPYIYFIQVLEVTEIP